MPTHCFSVLTVSGDIESFMELATDEHLSMQSLFPSDNHITDWGAEYRYSRLAEKSDDTAVFQLDTMNGFPPFEWVMEVGRRFPDLNFLFEWYSEGFNEYGTIEIENGKVILEERARVPFDDEDFRNPVFSHGYDWW